MNDKNTMDLIVEAVRGGNKIKAIKALREMFLARGFNFGLKDAKILIDGMTKVTPLLTIPVYCDHCGRYLGKRVEGGERPDVFCDICPAPNQTRSVW